MKIIEGDNYDRFILTVDCGDKPFSIFRVSDILYYNATLEKQIQEFFENTPTDYGDKFNSGERILKISVNSEEERYELSYLFIKEGFKIRHQEYSYLDKYQRVYRVENDFKADGNSDPDNICSEINIRPHYDRFSLYLRRKDTKKFLDFLKVLSSEYGYKTVYQDSAISREYLKCCTESDPNYKMKYIFK